MCTLVCRRRKLTTKCLILYVVKPHEKNKTRTNLDTHFNQQTTGSPAPTEDNAAAMDFCRVCLTSKHPWRRTARRRSSAFFARCKPAECFLWSKSNPQRSCSVKNNDGWASGIRFVFYLKTNKTCLEGSEEDNPLAAPIDTFCGWTVSSRGFVFHHHDWLVVNCRVLWFNH